MENIQAQTASEAAAAWWTYALHNVRRLYDESISHDICLGDLQPLYAHHLTAFRTKLQHELKYAVLDTAACTLSVINGQPCDLLARAANESRISLLYLQLMDQAIMCVYRHRVEVSEGEMALFKEIWSSSQHECCCTPHTAA